MKMLHFDAVDEKSRQSYRLSLDALSIIAIEEHLDAKHGKVCILRGRKGERYRVQGDFAAISERISPSETLWSELKEFLNTKLGTFLLTAIFVTGGGAALKRAIEQYSERQQRVAHEKGLLVEFDSRVSQMDARAEQIRSFKTDAEKGSATLCIYHLAAGDGICDSTATTGPKKSLMSIVNELTGLQVKVDPTLVLRTLGEIETERGENEVVTPGGKTRLYPEDVLEQRLIALKAYSRDAWKSLGGS